MKTLTATFPTMDEVIRVADLPCPADSQNHSRENGASERWDLELGWEGAWNAYCGGWAEGAQKAYDLAETLRPRPMAARTTLRRHVAGAFPNVPAHLAGHPQAMFQPVKRYAQGKPYVHLYMPLAYAAAVRAETAFDRGCALVALADSLESAGCRVRITGVEACKSGQTRYIGFYALKGYGERLDVDTLIFTVAHPAFFRRIIFAHMERSEHAAVRAMTQGGYGETWHVPDSELPDDGTGITVRFPELSYGETGTPESFLRKMVEALPEALRTEIGG